MPIDTREVRRIGHLACLDLDEALLDVFSRQLTSILDYVAMLEELEVDSVPPATGATVPKTRPDQERSSLPVEDALRNAPDAAAGHFRVPRVLKI